MRESNEAARTPWDTRVSGMAPLVSISNVMSKYLLSVLLRLCILLLVPYAFLYLVPMLYVYHMIQDDVHVSSMILYLHQEKSINKRIQIQISIWSFMHSYELLIVLSAIRP